MESENNKLPNQLTPFGRKTYERLEKLNKTTEWLARKIREANDNSLTEERLLQILSGEYFSRAKEAIIGVILHEEEERQRLKKKLGIKEG